MKIIKKLIIPVGCCSETIEWESDKDYCLLIGTYPNPQRYSLEEKYNDKPIYLIIIEELLKFQI